MVELTFLEKKLLDEIIRPALGPVKYDYRGSGQTVIFSILLSSVKEFYHRHEGPMADWHRVVVDAHL